MEDVRLRYFSQEDIDFREKLMEVLLEDGLLPESFRFVACGAKFNKFECRDVESHKDYQKHAIAFPYYCEQRICDRCCARRGYSVREQVIEILKHRNKTTRNKFSLLTVTKNMSTVRDLGPEQVKAFNKHVRKLVNTLFPKSSDCGALAVLEFGKKMNMHAHIVVFGPYYPQGFISRKWKEITGDSYIVHIRAIRDHKGIANYLVKYIAKSPSFENLEFYCQYLQAIKGVRRLHRYGVFYGFKVLEREAIKCPYCGGNLRFVLTIFYVNPCITREYSEILQDLNDESREN